ncbi:hypothetical protein ACOMHN_015008 [Nucella lapillus]
MEILGLVDIPLTLVLVVILIVSVYVYQTWHFNTWKNLGVEGPKPRFLCGNIPVDSRVDMGAEFAKWKKQYGRNYGIFVSRDPIFVTSDPEVIKEVAIKSFNNFPDRYSALHRLETKFTGKMIFSVRGPPWKRYRHVMTPAFTTGKLKALEGFMNRCSETLTDVLKDSATQQEDINLKETYQRFTMDVIAGTAFGLDTNLQRGQEAETHDMVRAMRGILSNINNVGVMLLAVSFPFTAPLLRALGYSVFPPKDLDFFKQCVTAIIRERDQNPQEAKKRADFLQQMMDLRVSPGEEVTDNVEEESGGTKTNKKLTEEEVVAQGIQVFNAGFETTSSTLMYLTYCLATHLDVQEKIHQEILAVVGQGEVQYEHLQQLKYLDCVIHETLRLYPILPNLSRLAKRAMVVKGYPIPAGVGVILAVYTATHDPDLYPDPFTFIPDRFADRNDSFLTSLPFGVGPRQCIGTRLAMQEMKTAIVHFCRAVRFVPCENTPKTLELDSKAFLLPRQPLIVRAEIRT